MNSTPEQFSMLLMWLNNGSDSEMEPYEEMRSRLISYFDRRQCHCSEDLTDETFSRVTTWITDKQNKQPTQEGDSAHHPDEPKKICYKTAYYVLREWRRNYEKYESDVPSVDNLSTQANLRAARNREFSVNATRTHHLRLDCLERCLETLPPEDAFLIVRYYDGETNAKEHRKCLAQLYKMKIENLTLKVSRLRRRVLEPCVKRCVDKGSN